MVVRLDLSSWACSEELLYGARTVEVESEMGSFVDISGPEAVIARDRLLRCLGGACSSNFMSPKMSSSGDEDNREFVSRYVLCLPTPPDTKSDELLWARVRMSPLVNRGELWFLSSRMGVGVSVVDSGNSKAADSPRAEGDECRLYEW